MNAPQVLQPPAAPTLDAAAVLLQLAACAQTPAASPPTTPPKSEEPTMSDETIRKILAEHGAYDADEARRIAGATSQEIETLLGYMDEAELIHRDNLITLP